MIECQCTGWNLLLDKGESTDVEAICLELEQLDPTVKLAAVGVVFHDDEACTKPFLVELQVRAYRDGTEGTVEGNSFVPSEPGPHAVAALKTVIKRWSDGTGSNLIEQRHFLRLRAANETVDALKALRYLFNHYCLHEELLRAEKLLACVSYDLEELPEVEEMRRQLREQIGHLDNVEDWYAKGSPSRVINEQYILIPPPNSLTPRLRWLAECCRSEGFKKVVEFGSVDGMSLFPLTRFAPEIEWHGVEISSDAVKWGKELAERVNIPINLHNATFYNFSMEHAREFDAAALFEVLEHNDMKHCRMILFSILRTIRHEGRLFITTPNGNWSAHDEKTRDLKIKKDHINAWTVKRMEGFLNSIPGLTDIHVFAVENPSYWEANSWVFASAKVI